jgi:hypothetical protein
MLSQNTKVALFVGRRSSPRSWQSQQVSETALATALYSASALDQETVGCRLEDQATRLSPRKHNILMLSAVYPGIPPNQHQNMQ